MSKDKIKVLVADDSPTAREIIVAILESDPEIEVIGKAKDGKEATELVAQLKPDLVTLDVHMPVMDGMEATKQIMAYNPTPILILTSSSRFVKGGTVQPFEAISAGALDVMEKPAPEVWSDMPRVGGELIKRVKLLSKIKVVTHLAGREKRSISKQTPPDLPAATLAAQAGKKAGELKVIAIASSTGGPKALAKILSRLPAELTAGIVIVQHIAEGFSEGLAEWLNKESKIKVKEAQRGDKIEPGLALIAPNGFHTMVTNSGMIKLNDGAPMGEHRPSADVLLLSVASVYGLRSVGVILTGMGSDGAKGIAAIKNAGGKTIAQDAESCVVFGMPKAAIEMGVVDEVLPLDAIAEGIIRLCS